MIDRWFIFYAAGSLSVVTLRWAVLAVLTRWHQRRMWVKWMTNNLVFSGNDSPLIDITPIYNYWRLVYFYCCWNSVAGPPTLDVSILTRTYENEAHAEKEFGRVADICGDKWFIHGDSTITKDYGVLLEGGVSGWFPGDLASLCRKCAVNRSMFYKVNNQHNTQYLSKAIHHQ